MVYVTLKKLPAGRENNRQMRQTPCESFSLKGLSVLDTDNFIWKLSVLTVNLCQYLSKSFYRKSVHSVAITVTPPGSLPVHARTAPMCSKRKDPHDKNGLLGIDFKNMSNHQQRYNYKHSINMVKLLISVQLFHVVHTNILFHMLFLSTVELNYV